MGPFPCNPNIPSLSPQERGRQPLPAHSRVLSWHHIVSLRTTVTRATRNTVGDHPAKPPLNHRINARTTDRTRDHPINIPLGWMIATPAYPAERFAYSSFIHSSPADIHPSSSTLRKPSGDPALPTTCTMNPTRHRTAAPLPNHGFRVPESASSPISSSLHPNVSSCGR